MNRYAFGLQGGQRLPISPMSLWPGWFYLHFSPLYMNQWLASVGFGWLRKKGIQGHRAAVF